MQRPAGFDHLRHRIETRDNGLVRTYCGHWIEPPPPPAPGEARPVCRRCDTAWLVKRGRSAIASIFARRR